MVTSAGFNALLKIVEEPPDHLIFVFATTEPEKVLPTIRSRTHHYPFRLLAPRTMRSLLERICEQEGVAVDETVYPLVIRAGGGSPRDTLSVLDQLLAGADGNRILYPRALALLGATDVALIDDAIDALAAGDAAALFGAVEGVIDAGHDPRRFATDLLERFRDLIVLQAVPDAAARGVVDAPGDVLERMRDQAARVGAGTLTRYAEVVHAGLGEMRGATAPRLLLEVVCARLLLPSASDTESALLQRLERIETRLEMSIPSDSATSASPSAQPAKASKQFVRKTKAAAPPPQEQAPPAPKPVVPEPAAPEPTPPETVEPAPVSPPPVQPPADPVVEIPATAADAVTGEPDAAAIRRQWSTVLDKVRDRSRSLAVMLAGAVVRTVDGGTLLLNHESSPLAKRLNESRNAEVVQEALKDALGIGLKVRYEVGAAGDVTATESSAAEVGDAARDEEDDMLAEAGSDNSETVRRDPEEAALELLQNELGARRIDGG
jgi:DNA polymerase-3 subunit gamma/tau